MHRSIAILALFAGVAFGQSGVVLPQTAGCVVLHESGREWVPAPCPPGGSPSPTYGQLPQVDSAPSWGKISMRADKAVRSADPVEWLVHYTTSEPCRDCTTVYTVACSPYTPDCGIPRVAVDHYESFVTKAEALRFMNDGLMRKSDGSQWIVGYREPKDYPRTFVRLLKVAVEPVTTEKAVEEIPQPSKTVETTKYR